MRNINVLVPESIIQRIEGEARRLSECDEMRKVYTRSDLVRVILYAYCMDLDWRDKANAERGNE